MKVLFKITAVAISLLTLSCAQKEMKISRANVSIKTEITDFSPAYITKNNDGSIAVNKNNLIGNTHWVLSVDRSLTLKEIAQPLQELLDKKFHKEGMHEDTKDIYIVYSDTLHKNNAYLKLPFKNIVFTNDAQDLILLNGNEDLLSITLNSKLGFQQNATFEDFVNKLIVLDQSNKGISIEKELYLY